MGYGSISGYGHWKYFNSYSAGIDFRRQHLTSTDVRDADVFRRQMLTYIDGPRAERVKLSGVGNKVNLQGSKIMI